MSCSFLCEATKRQEFDNTYILDRATTGHRRRTWRVIGALLTRERAGRRPRVGYVHRVNSPSSGCAPRDAAATRHEAAPRRVMLVDDNVDGAELMELVLNSWGCVTERLEDGASALAKVAAFRPDAVLLDIGLPDMDGYDLVRRLRDLPATRDARIIAISGHAMPQDRARALEAGFDDHLGKPADLDALRRCLEQA